MVLQLLGGSTIIDVSLSGFTDTDKHGIHVHEHGSIDDKCAAAGDHFDPHGSDHGLPDDPVRFVASNLKWTSSLRVTHCYGLPASRV